MGFDGTTLFFFMRTRPKKREKGHQEKSNKWVEKNNGSTDFDEREDPDSRKSTAADCPILSTRKGAKPSEKNLIARVQFESKKGVQTQNPIFKRPYLSQFSSVLVDN